MKKCVNKQFDETYYEETLDNGLRVIIWKKEGFASTSAAFATHFGALDIMQKIADEQIISHPSGTAHFLEHKCFESSKGDVLEIFSGMGANVNAYTSYNETVYYFSTSVDDIAEPLNQLLDFVQDFEVSEASVEKEKGIIVQEYKMYQQLPDNRLINEILKAMYAEHPLKYDIVGDEESIYSISKEALEKAHRLNYHPSNMLLVVVSGKDEKMIMDTIRANQAGKKFRDAHPIVRVLSQEPLQPVVRSAEIAMDVSCNKIALAYKLPVWKEDRIKKEWAVRFVLESIFSPINPEYQKWIDEKLIKDTFSYDVDFSSDYAFILFFNEDIEKDRFIEFVEAKLHDVAISYEVTQQLKRRYYGQAIRVFNSTEDIAINVIRNTFEKTSLFETLQILNTISAKDCEEIFSQVSFDYRAAVEIVPFIDKCENCDESCRENEN